MERCQADLILARFELIWSLLFKEKIILFIFQETLHPIEYYIFNNLHPSLSTVI